MTNFLTLFISILFSSVIALGAVTEIEIPPNKINKSAKIYRGNHRAFWDQGVPSQGLLLVSLGGTHSLPSDFRSFDQLAATMGFDVLAVDYDNHVISTTCKDSSDDLCFDRFREEVVLGNSVSPLLEVDRPNAISTRITDILKNLKQADSARWSRYFHHNQVQWNKVVVVGHSQGSGHAVYLGKKFRLHGVLMFAGPQDRFSDESRTVAWIEKPGRTPGDRHYGFLHEQDFFGASGQLRAARKLLGSTPVHQHVIVTNEEVRDPHMSVITPQFKNVWIKLLQIQLDRK